MHITSNKVKIGDILYADGSISSSYISTKTPIGVIFHLNSGFPIHGKAIALKDVCTTYWSRDYMLLNCCLTTTLSSIAGQDDSGRTSSVDIAYDLRDDNCAAEVSINYSNSSWPERFRNVWYLPTFGELFKVYENIEAVNKGIVAAGGQTTDGEYWTSTQADEQQAWWHSLNYSSGNMGDYLNHTKTDMLNVRAVVAF